jgi:hypothetical protein
MARARTEASGKERSGPPASRAATPLPGLSNSTVARLARDRDGRRLLARWHLVASGGYATASPVGSVGNPFTWQEEEITIQPRVAGGSGIQYLQHTAAAPNLKVSADNTVAMQDTPGEAKEAYVDPQVRTNANATLQGRGSPVELGSAGHTVTVNAYKGAPQRTLEKVRPKARSDQPHANLINAPDFPAVAVAICRDAAERILGGKLTGIQLGGPGGLTVPASTSDPNVVTGTQQLAAAVASRNLSLADAAAKMAVAKVPKPGKKYGKATLGDKVGARANTLGINDSAWARAGQAYVIQTVYPEKEADTRNYSDPLQPDITQGFGYHFAAAVAESLDGRDALTLENYRRGGEIAAAATRLFAELQRTFADDLATAVSNLGAYRLTDTDKIGAILEYIETNTAPDINTANAKWKQVVGELGNPASLWFFRMVSRDTPNQSFHRQLSSSGYFRSPITFVMVN